MMNKYVKVPEVYGFQTLFREIGYYVSRFEQYERSLKYFDEALKKTPKDKRALIGRSRARAKVNQYEGALEDINKALGLDADDLVVLADKGLITYLCCEFEEGLVQNSRLVPKRQKPENFAMGVMQCSDAIENCVGERTGRPLRDHFKIIRKLAWKKNYAASKPFEPTATNKPKKKKLRILGREINLQSREPVQPKKLKPIKSALMTSEMALSLEITDSLHSVPSDNELVPRFSKPFPYRPLQNYTSNIENYMAEKYLDAMYLDKIFLKKLQSEPGAKCPNIEGTKRIRQLAKHTFKSVSYKQEFLRTRRPFYFIKYQEATVSGELKYRQQLELEHQQRNTKAEADAILNKMINAYNRKDLKGLLEAVKKLKRFCNTKPKKFLTDKNVYMNQIYDIVCKGWYDVYRINYNQSNYSNQKRIYFILGLPLSRDPSTDSVLGQFKNVFIDYKKEIKEIEKSLQEAEQEEEICWYYHELARYHYEIRKYDLARAYARKCIHEASIINNLRWIFNCLMITVKSNLAEHNKNDARNDILKAVNCANTLKDQEKMDYLKICQEVVESVELDDVFGTKQLELRENKIIQMMASSKMKDEVAHLFRQMAAMPASRRMVVIPGVRAQETLGTKRGKGMSIMPGGSNTSNTGLKSMRSISKDRGSENKGRNMMDLIRFD